jgi:hypothetical protein
MSCRAQPVVNERPYLPVLETSEVALEGQALFQLAEGGLIEFPLKFGLTD